MSEPDAAVWPDEQRMVLLHELAELAGLPEATVMELVEFGALVPADAAEGRWRFSARSITVARTARRLGQDYELETHGVALLLGYLDRIRELEAQLCALRAQLPR